MRTVTTRDLRNRLAECLDAAQAGEKVVVTRRGNPVAEIVGTSSADEPSPRVAEALAAGIARRPGDAEGLKRLLADPPIGKPVNLVDQLLADRGP